MLFWIPVVFNSFKATLTTTSQLIRHQSASLTRPTEQFECSRCTSEVWLTSAGFAFQSCHKLFCPAVRCEALSTDLRSLMRLASGQPRQRCGLHLGWKLEPPEPNCISDSVHGGAAVAGLSLIDPNALFNSSEVWWIEPEISFRKQTRRWFTESKCCVNVIQKEKIWCQTHYYSVTFIQAIISVIWDYLKIHLILKTHFS